MLTIEQAAEQYNITVTRSDEPGAYHVAGFEVSTGPAVLFFKVVDAENKPVGGLPVLTQNGGTIITNPTNAEGYTDIPMGAGSWYYAEQGQSGPHTARLLTMPGDVVSGLGMRHGIGHDSLVTIWQGPGEGGNVSDIEYDLGELNMYTHFREARVQPKAGAGYHVTKLTAVGVPRKRDDKVLVATFLNADGSPAEGVRVRFGVQGNMGPAQLTDSNGLVSFYMGEDCHYSVPGEPPVCVVPVQAGDEIGDRLVTGVVAGRWDWLEPVYQWSDGAVELPTKPRFSDLEVAWRAFEVEVTCPDAASIGYTLDGPDYHRSDEAVWDSERFVVTVGGLQPATTYVLKAWGVNAAGDGPDAFLEFTTLDDEEPEEPDEPVPCEEIVNYVIAKLEDLIQDLETFRDQQQP